jgi:hypothetical protein
MSENGPREGTKDLPRRPPDAAHRSVDPDSPSGRAYARLGRQEARRRSELAELLRGGLSAEATAARYGHDHPLEREVSPDELAALVPNPGPRPRAGHARS